MPKCALHDQERPGGAVRHHGHLTKKSIMLDTLSNMKNSKPPHESAKQPDINVRIASRVRELRAMRGASLDALTAQCGVSKSMISLIERGEASPTAATLEKLAAGLGVSMAALFGPDDAATELEPLSRRSEQLIWKDPESGYMRRALTPPNWPTPIQIVEVHLPAGARVTYESGARQPAQEQQAWVVQGQIEVTLGDQLFSLRSGDCLAMRLDRPLVYANPTTRAARYIVAICDPAPIQLIQARTPT
jgi:transcriptional regulator with XRE-family HTH domain